MGNNLVLLNAVDKYYIIIRVTPFANKHRLLFLWVSISIFVICIICNLFLPIKKIEVVKPMPLFSSLLILRTVIVVPVFM